MASSNTKRTRSERVASLKLEPSSLSRWLRSLLTGKCLLQLALACVAGLLIIFIMRGWLPPFAYREGQIPERDVISRVDFTIDDLEKTEIRRDEARRDVLCIYENNPDLVNQLGRDIRNHFSMLTSETAFTDLSEAQRGILRDFVGAAAENSEGKISEQEALARIRSLVEQHGNLEGGMLDQAVKAILDPIADSGVLKSLEHLPEQGSQTQILVDGSYVVNTAQVLRAEVVEKLPTLVAEKFKEAFDSPDANIVAGLISNYLVTKMPESLTYRKDLSDVKRREAEASVQTETRSYYANQTRLAESGIPITREDQLPVLLEEHRTWVESLTFGELLIRLLAFCGMLAAFFMLTSLFIHLQYAPHLLTSTPQLMRLLGTVVVTCFVCKHAAADPFRAEVIPLVLCVITLTVAFGKQVSLLVTTCVALTVTLALGLDIGEFVTLCSATCAAAIFLGRIRTRTKLIYVGLAAAVIVAATDFGVGVVQGKLHALPPATEAIQTAVPNWLVLIPGLFQESLRLGGFTLLASALMTGLLPFVERVYAVQTDMSLLELGDASHPLLRQLAQRAPGTYNHSINVAAISEAAADSIGAHGLLTRVGAYFHDIGKMFKPNYFIENQEQGGNRHDQLQPAMSTLVIIAHVKDGADLARQHRLPKPIIDFIEQHHGTTLVEYFFREAEKRSQENPNKEEVSETSFRYPGPKPQTLEAAVLMLADSVESASRTLVEPTPSRIQNLVEQIAMKKLLDGQFDECGLTLQQLDRVKSSLVKSLTAIYHGRVKYTGQASA